MRKLERIIRGQQVWELYTQFYIERWGLQNALALRVGIHIRNTTTWKL